MFSPSLLFDSFLIIVVFLFSMVGYFRGFGKELSSMFTLIFAIFFTYLISPIISPIIISKIAYSKTLVGIIVKFLIFAIIYFIIFIFMHKLQDCISEKIPSSLNSSLGFMLSFCKIYIVFSLIFSGLIYIYSYNSDKKTTEKIGPQWLTQSVTYNFLDFGKKIVDPIFIGVTKTFISTNKEKTSTENNNNFQKNIEKVIEINLDNVINKEEGYSEEDIDEMNNLINNIIK